MPLFRDPAPPRGIDSDSDSAFINDHLYRYTQKERITFARSRPYKENDQAHIEQKNWSVVRRLIGYDRYGSTQALAHMNAVYDALLTRRLPVHTPVRGSLCRTPRGTWHSQ